MIKKTVLFTTIALVMLIILSACGGGGDSAAEPSGDASAGEDLFSQPLIGAQPGCATCHSLTPDQVLVGPSMAGIGSRAENRVSGQSAEDYIRESILNPDAYIVDGFSAGVMVQVWQEELSDDQVDNLVAYLLTLK